MYRERSTTGIGQLTGWLVILLIAVAWPYPAFGQPRDLSARAPEGLRTALYETTVHYKIAKERREEDYLWMASALALYKEGGSVKEVVTTVKEQQRRFKATLHTAQTGEWKIDARVRRGIVAIASMFGGGAMRPGASAGFGEIANIAVDSVENALRSSRVHYALRQRANQLLTSDAAKRMIVRAWVETYQKVKQPQDKDSDFREVHRALFEPEQQMNPLSTPEQIFAAHPDIRNELKLHQVLRNQSDLKGIKENVEIVKGTLASVRDKTKKTLDDMDNNVASVTDLVKELRYTAAERLAEEEAARQDRVRVAGQKAVVFLVSTVVGFEEPATARALQTIGDAYFNIAEATKTFDRVTGDYSKLTGWASAALTADILGAVLPVLGLLIDSGPSADEIIIEELGHLRKEVEDVRKQMHQRFDRIDKRLTEIHNTMIAGLDGLAKGIKGVRGDIAEVRHILLKHSTKLHDLYDVATDRTKAILELVESVAIGQCTHQKQDFGEISLDEFRRCLGNIRVVARVGLPGAQVVAPSETALLTRNLFNNPDGMTNAVTQEFRRRSGILTLPKRVVVGPEGWAHIAVTHDDYIRSWPQLARGVDGTNYAGTMNRYRTDLEMYIEAIRNDLVRYGDPNEAKNGRAKTVFGRLIRDVREMKQQLEDAMTRESERLGREDEDTGLRFGKRYFRDVVQRIDWSTFERIVWEDYVGDEKLKCDYQCQKAELEDGCQSADYRKLPVDGTVININQVNELNAYKATARDRPGPFHNWSDHFKRDSRKALWHDVLPPALQNMLALGIGELRLCVIGGVRGTNHLSNAFAGGDHAIRAEKRKDRFYQLKVEVDARSLARVEFKGECLDAEGVNRTAEARAIGAGTSALDIFLYTDRSFVQFTTWQKFLDNRPVDDKTVAMSIDPNRKTWTKVMREAYDAAMGQVAKSKNIWAEHVVRQCMPEYERRFEERQKARANAVVEAEPVRDAVRRYDRAVKEANAYLSAWIRLALNDAIALSDPIAALATGNFRFPTWEETKRHVTWERHAWHRPDRLEEGIRGVEEVLGSAHVRYMASKHAGYAVVTGTAYDSLDPENR